MASTNLPKQPKTVKATRSNASVSRERDHTLKDSRVPLQRHNSLSNPRYTLTVHPHGTTGGRLGDDTNTLLTVAACSSTHVGWLPLISDSTSLLCTRGVASIARRRRASVGRRGAGIFWWSAGISWWSASIFWWSAGIFWCVFRWATCIPSRGGLHFGALPRLPQPIA